MAHQTETAELKKLDIRSVKVKIKGLSPMIMHRWSDKARNAILDKQMKKTIKEQPKDPEAQFNESVYRLDDERVGFPADAFKKAMVRGAKQLELTMTDMRTGFFVHGEYCTRDDRDLVPIDGELLMREDMVRIGGQKGKSVDIRYRGQVNSWRAELPIDYNATVVSFDQIVNMLHAAGFGVGVGEWRPERDGMFGRFEVETE